MAQRIAMFNHKGGVSKTTTTFNLAWMLAEKGKKVLVVDTDPQCNLTGLMLGYDAFEEHYQKNPQQTIKAALSPAFESKPKMIEPFDCLKTKHPQVSLLPGDIGFSEYEVTLGLSQELSGTVAALHNIPGAMSYLLEVTADAIEADYILVDMSPSLSSINQNLLTTSDFFLVPTSPDYFSVMAIRSLTRTLPRWKRWADKFVDMPFFEDSAYAFPRKNPRFLGTIIQNFRIRSGEPTRGYKYWVDKINDEVKQTFAPALEEVAMLLDGEASAAYGMPSNFCTGLIPDFNTLMPKSQSHSVPVYALKKHQLENVGQVLVQNQKKQAEFKRIFSEMADRVMSLPEGE